MPKVRQNFNPRSPSGLRPNSCLPLLYSKYFNPRSPSGLRRTFTFYIQVCFIFQSTQPEWAATGRFCCSCTANHLISIHAARVGCDCDVGMEFPEVYISIHAARVGCDSFCRTIDRITVYFNPRSPSGLRQCNPCRPFRPAVRISIHAARVGCDYGF